MNKPVFVTGDKLYAAFNGIVVMGHMVGLDARKNVFIKTEDDNVLGVDISLLFDNQHEAEIRSLPMKQMLYFYPSETDKLTTAKLIGFEDSYGNGESRTIKRLIVVIEGGMGIYADEVFSSKKSAMETPKITKRKKYKNGHIDTCVMQPEQLKSKVIILKCSINGMPEFPVHMN